VTINRSHPLIPPQATNLLATWIGHIFGKERIADIDVECLDAIAEFYDRDRSDQIVGSLCEYLDKTADSGPFQELVATDHYDDQLEFNTVTQLVGAETTQRLRLLKMDLNYDQIDLAAPGDVDIYDGDIAADDGR
jgi:hypothetical protein